MNFPVVCTTAVFFTVVLGTQTKETHVEKHDKVQDQESSASGYIYRTDGQNSPLFVRLGEGNNEKYNAILDNFKKQNGFKGKPTAASEEESRSNDGGVNKRLAATRGSPAAAPRANGSANKTPMTQVAKAVRPSSPYNIPVVGEENSYSFGGRNVESSRQESQSGDSTDDFDNDTWMQDDPEDDDNDDDEDYSSQQQQLQQQRQQQQMQQQQMQQQQQQQQQRPRQQQQQRPRQQQSRQQQQQRWRQQNQRPVLQQPQEEDAESDENPFNFDDDFRSMLAFTGPSPFRFHREVSAENPSPYKFHRNGSPNVLSPFKYHRDVSANGRQKDNSAKGNEDVENYQAASYTPKEYKKAPGKHKAGQAFHKAGQFYSKGTMGDKGHKHHHAFDKGHEGHYAGDDAKGHYNKAKGHSSGFKAEGDHHEKHKTGAHGEKGTKFGETEDIKKGHNTKGFHNVYHKDEFNKEQNFYDDAHKQGKVDSYGNKHKDFKQKGGGKKHVGHKDAGYDEDHKGASGHFKKGQSHGHHKGHLDDHGHKVHHHNKADYEGTGGHKMYDEHEHHHGGHHHHPHHHHKGGHHYHKGDHHHHKGDHHHKGHYNKGDYHKGGYHKGDYDFY